MPSKALLKVAKVYYQMRSAVRYGLTLVSARVTLKEVMAHVKIVVDEIYQDETPEALRGKKMDVFMDEARFVDAHTIEVGN